MVRKATTGLDCKCPAGKRQSCQTEGFTIVYNSSIWISWKPRFWHLILNFEKFMKILWHFFIQIFAKISKIEIQNSKITICSIQEAPKLHLKSLRRNWLVYSDDIRGLKFENSKIKLEILVLNMNNHVSKWRHITWLIFASYFQLGNSNLRCPRTPYS